MEAKLVALLVRISLSEGNDLGREYVGITGGENLGTSKRTKDQSETSGDIDLITNRK